MNKTISVPALDKAVKILDLLTQQGVAMSGAEIAKKLKLPRSSVHGLLNALLEAGLLRKKDERFFLLGSHIMFWANGFLSQHNVVNEFQQAIKVIPELQPYTLTLSTLDHDRVVYLACKNSQAPLGFTFKIGMQLPAVFTATGKIMLSTLPEEEVYQRIQQFPQPYTENSISSFAELFTEFIQIRQQGYAIDNGQIRLGMHCFGVAVYDHTHQARYGIAASLTVDEADEKTIYHLTAGLNKLATQLSYSLGFKS